MTEPKTGIEAMPAVHIAPQHQSAPRETEADRAVRLAGAEIESGGWRLSQAQENELDAVPGVALRAGPEAAVDPVKNPWSALDFERTDQTLLLGEHPRVQEALAKLEAEKRESKGGQEYAERAAMIHETLENSRRRHRWEGQERWQEDDILERRKGKILSPLDFYRTLMEQGLGKPARMGNVHDYPVKQMEWTDGILKEENLWVRTIGSGRLLLGRDVKKMHVDDPSGRVALLVMANTDSPILLPGQKAQSEEPVQVATLQWPLGTEWMTMRFDEFGVPRTPRYIGWRTALLALVRNGAVTAAEAERAFPVGAETQASWYKQQMFEFKGRR